MRFSIYDILSNLIPGSIFIGFISMVYDKSLSDYGILSSLAVAYAIGFIFNAIASWIEPILFWTWLGKPSDRILDGKRMWKIKFFQSQKAKDLLSRETETKSPSNDELFGIAMGYLNAVDEKSRIYDFNAAYAFSRTFFVTLTILYIISIIKLSDNNLIIFGGIVILLVVWYRTKQRAYYLVKEILNNYLYLCS